LVIAKLDRLSQNASFIFALRDSGLNFQCVDTPDAYTLIISIFATLAQHERELISSRTKAALAAKKCRGQAGQTREPDSVRTSQRNGG
jgi:DNA invertase Pin-like site-specific DNA recombinase